MGNTIKFSDLPILDSLNDADKFVIGQQDGQFATLPAAKLPKPEGGGGGDDPYILNGNTIFDAQDPSDVRAEMWKFITAIKANKNRRVFIAPSDDSYGYNTMRSVDFNLSDRYFELYISQIIASGEPVGPDNICDLYCSAITISGEYTDTDVTSISISNGQVKLLDMEHAPEVTSPAEIDHFRIINKNGESQKASIAQVRELMGMDYSKLEEQIVHGGYWLDADGVKRQVYCRTFILEGTVTSGNFVLSQRLYIGIASVVSIKGSYEETPRVDGVTREYPLGANSVVVYKNANLVGVFDIRHDFKDDLIVGSTAKIKINIEYIKL